MSNHQDTQHQTIVKQNWGVKVTFQPLGFGTVGAFIENDETRDSVLSVESAILSELWSEVKKGRETVEVCIAKGVPEKAVTTIICLWSKGREKEVTVSKADTFKSWLEDVSKRPRQTGLLFTPFKCPSCLCMVRKGQDTEDGVVCWNCYHEAAGYGIGL